MGVRAGNADQPSFVIWEQLTYPIRRAQQPVPLQRGAKAASGWGSGSDVPIYGSSLLTPLHGHSMLCHYKRSNGVRTGTACCAATKRGNGDGGLGTARIFGGILLEYWRSGTSKQVRERKLFEPMTNL